MAAAVACLLPSLEILPRGAIGRLSFEPALFVAGVMGLGAVIVHVGLGGALAAAATILLLWPLDAVWLSALRWLPAG